VHYFRKPLAAEPDPRISEFAEKLSHLDVYLREALAQMRKDAPEDATRTRKEIADSFLDLRKEVVGNITTLGETLKIELAKFGAESTASAERLRSDVEQKMRSISQAFADFKNETGEKHSALEASLSRKLVELMESNAAHQEKLRMAVEERLNKLNEVNAVKLEEMRVTVDEKLSVTLNDRLTKSFGQVTTHLGEVQKGLGEMKELATGVNDLNRVFSNVRSRGDVGEAILGDLITEILAPVQFRQKVNVNPATREVVEYAVCLPSANGEILLPIDSKFPREDWARLQAASETGVTKDIVAAGKGFETAIRVQAKLISTTYINEPITTPHAIMFLPTESLYAEVIKRDGLQEDIQRAYHITIAGPSTLSAILISFKMGFRMLNLQQKGNDVWKVLAATRTEFNKFGQLMNSMEKQVGTVQNTIHSIGVRTRAINRTLDDVSEADASQDNVLGFDGVAPRLAAGGNED
jgi:DNA recombination protein RmuC